MKAARASEHAPAEGRATAVARQGGEKSVAARLQERIGNLAVGRALADQLRLGTSAQLLDRGGGPRTAPGEGSFDHDLSAVPVDDEAPRIMLTSGDRAAEQHATDDLVRQRRHRQPAPATPPGPAEPVRAPPTPTLTSVEPPAELPDPGPRADDAADEPATEASGAEAVPAPSLQVPDPSTPAQQALHERLVPETVAAQARFTATVTSGIHDLLATVDHEQRELRATARGQRGRVRGAFGRAHSAVREAIERAVAEVTGAGLDAETSLDSWHRAARPASEQLVEDAQREARGIADRESDDAVELANAKAGDARAQIAGFAVQANRRGSRKIEEADGGSEKATEARRRAAAQVTIDTVEAITENLAETISELEGLGPALRPEFVAGANQLSERFAAQLPDVVSQVDETRNAAVGMVASTVTDNAASLHELGTTYVDGLDELETTVLSSLRTATRASLDVLAGGGHAAVAAARVQHDAVAAAGAELITTILGRAADPSIRRDAALELASQLGPTLRDGFGTAQDLAQLAMAQVATTFAGAAEQARQALEEAGEEGAHRARPVAGAASQAAQQQAAELVGQMSQMLIDVLADGDGLLEQVSEGLDDGVDGFAAGLDEALRELSRVLDGKVQEAADNARAPLDSLDERLREAMGKAQREVEKGWVRRQLSAINWGFLAGLLVGLLVTIVVIALLGTGIGALILAGALAGALSAAASVVTESMVARQPIDWGELGRQMVIGAVTGAVGGAVGGGAGAVLARQTAMSAGRRVAVQTAVDLSSSVGIGTAQNLYEGKPWDEGLLLNLATTGGMSSRPVSTRVQNLTTRARASAVDRGRAFRVTEAERAQSHARMAEAAARRTGDAGGGARTAESAPAGPVRDQATEPAAGGPGRDQATESAPAGPVRDPAVTAEPAPASPARDPAVAAEPPAPTRGQPDVELAAPRDGGGGAPARRPSGPVEPPPPGGGDRHQREAARQYRLEADRLEIWARDAGSSETVQPARPRSVRPGDRRAARLTPDEARAEARDLRREALDFESGRTHPLEDLSSDLVADAIGALERPRDGGAPAKREGGRTVLGHFPEYVEMSNALMARRYEIPGSAWDRMSPSRRWAANEQFLERTVARGDEIQLSTRHDRINPDPNNYLRREIAYLEGRGYRVSPDGWQMLPPPPTAVHGTPTPSAAVPQATPHAGPAGRSETSFADVITSTPPTEALRSASAAAREGSTLPVDAMVGTHSSSHLVRRGAGVTGAQFESAHIIAQTIGAAINRVLPGRYSPGRALAILLPPEAHTAFDRGWVTQWNQRMRSNERTTVADARNLLRAAIDDVPANLMTPGEKGALLTVIDHQLFQGLGLSPDLVLIGGP
jgi:hypothetical protein